MKKNITILIEVSYLNGHSVEHSFSRVVDEEDLEEEIINLYEDSIEEFIPEFSYKVISIEEVN